MADRDVAQGADVEDARVIAYRAVIGSYAFGIAVDERDEAIDERGVVAVQGDDVCKVGGKAGADGHFASAGFIEYADPRAVAEGAPSFGDDEIGVLDKAPCADVVVGDVVLDVFNQGVISYGAVVQGGVADAGMDGDTAREGEGMLKDAQADGT